MKTNIWAIWIIFFQLSCNNIDDNNSIRPKNSLYFTRFNKEDFINLGPIEKGNNLWNDMNHAKYTISVHLVDSELILSEPFRENYFFELNDGKLEIINRGEFGGGLNFISSDTTIEKISICKAPIYYVFKFHKKIYFMTGSAHGFDQGGTMYELIRENGDFKYIKKIELDSAPEAMAIYKDKILIAGHQMFTIIEDFKKENILQGTFWNSLYPNSIAVKNSNEVYIGMRGGYSKLSLITKKVEYHQYVGE